MKQIKYRLLGKRSKEISFASPARDGPRIREPVKGNFSSKERKSDMKKMILTVVLFISLFLPIKAYAAGTAAGTVISNAATANYTVSGTPATVSSNTVTVKVVEIINHTLTWQDVANVTVLSGQSNAMLTFKLTNTGNGTEKFSLAGNTSISGDNFDPAFVSIYLDTSGNGSYDSGTDTAYTAGTNDPNLAADGYITLFVFCNIPTGLADNDLGFAQLAATSKTGTGAAGTVFAGSGDGGVDAVIGSSGGTANTIGKHQASSVAAIVDVSKSAAVSNSYGNTEPIPGATIRYTLVVTVTGTGAATSVVITDPVPANTTYAAGTLKLNSSALSDAKDSDAGDVGGTTAGTVTVSLGNMTSATAAQTIIFDVTIN